MPYSRLSIAALCMVCYLCACGREAVGPPAGALPFTPPVKFRGWWALTEACSGQTGDFDAVRWFVLPAGDSTFQLEGQTVGAAWYGDGNKIVFAAGQQIFSGLVRHEMLHALMKVPGHPRDQFLDRCGDIVDCAGQCVTDAGGPPAFSDTAPTVAPTALRVTTLLAPNPVTLSADSGWFPLTVMVSNDMPHAVRVPIPFPNNGDSAGSSFEYLIVPTGGGQSKWGGYTQRDGTDLDFAPAGTAGATRRLVFDTYPTLLGLAPGDYDVSGIFLGPTSAPTVLHALP